MQRAILEVLASLTLRTSPYVILIPERNSQHRYVRGLTLLELGLLKESHS
jgi:hypothetical protein